LHVRAGVWVYGLLLFLTANGPVASTKGILFGPAIARVSLVHNGEDIQQLWVAADPSDGRHLIACGRDHYFRQNVTTGYVYTSADAGATWHRTVVDNATKWVSEESCTYAENGRAYFAAGESDTSTGVTRHQWGHLKVFASNDHGMHWKQTWKRKEGWVDWTFLATEPGSNSFSPLLTVFGNAGTDKLGHFWENQPVVTDSADLPHADANAQMLQIDVRSRRFPGFKRQCLRCH